MNVVVKDTLNVIIPDDFQKMNSMPEDPENSVVYGKQTSSADCFVIIFPINPANAMPFDNEREVISGIHNSLAEDQGLIEVKAGVTRQNNKFIYSIVKTKLNPSGMQYTLVMHLDYGVDVLNVQAYFSEIGMTGQRDNTILNKLISEGVIVMPDMSKWMQDPYDANYTKGIRMNLSENEQYDNAFPNHPLSEIRKLINSIVKQ